MSDSSQSGPPTKSPTNPLFNENRLKLGVMGFNCSHGSTVTNDPLAWPMTWADNVRLAKMADDAGFEALLPVGRWRGYGGETNFNHRAFESFTWASGISASTDKIAVLATVHAPLVHPVTAAKQAATIDHISGGRFVMNIVCGWNKPEFDMFGAAWREHDRRYEYAAEWITFMRRLWSETEEFDFDGEFFKGKALWSEPKPVQSPVPLMNAGSSPAGQAFSARHCDMNFVMLRQQSEVADTTQISHLKQLALNDGRSSQCWIHAYVVCRDTQAEAQAVLERYVTENGDWDTAARMVSMFGIESNTLSPDVLEDFKFHFIAGHGGYPLVGTPEQIVEKMLRLSEMGIDGLLLSWLDYLGECAQWIEKVLPLMEDAGLRRPRG
ncbi:MAG: FMNH2-dependent dimethyl sulfone monooxygenase [Gammaproteobacteria bacterium]|jgi:FMNH2-dependent dimethyl sulfone monooxygenase